MYYQFPKIQADNQGLKSQYKMEMLRKPNPYQIKAQGADSSSVRVYRADQPSCTELQPHLREQLPMFSVRSLQGCSHQH